MRPAPTRPRPALAALIGLALLAAGCSSKGVDPDTAEVTPDGTVRPAPAPTPTPTPAAEGAASAPAAAPADPAEPKP